MEHKPLTWQYVPIALTFYTYILQEEFAVLAAMNRGIQTSTKHRVRLKEVVTQYALTRRAGFQEQYLDLFLTHKSSNSQRLTRESRISIKQELIFCELMSQYN